MVEIKKADEFGDNIKDEISGINFSVYMKYYKNQ